ncbi:putative disease resistance protein RGA1 [Silene latifolia]|uniref:putative disease resistance protein RGA1 n=1 Tax=Silene latifolia TaxID=37657 RepID=UPI003D786C7F
MAEAIIFPIAKGIVKKIASFTGDRVLNLIDGEIKAAKSAKEDLKIIAEDLTAICAVLQDAEVKQYRNDTMKLWLKDLKTLVYDIDDLLDDVAIDSLRSSVNKSHLFPQLRYYFSSSNPVISRFQLTHKIKDLGQKLERIVARKTKFGLTEHPIEVSRPSRDLFNDISYLNRSSVVGRDEAKKQVMRSLLSVGDASCLSVLPITGIGGIGKTTLAKLVYDDLRNEFDMKIWGCVSDQFNLIKLLEDIIKDVSGIDTTNNTLGQLVNKLQHLLRGQKYMLVLDDVWDDAVADWKELRSLLEVGEAGSVVLITTRSRQIASDTQTMGVFDLDRLSDETSWLIFSQIAFREGEEQRYPFLCEIGRSIVEKCGGVPLVIKSIASLLRRDRDEREWQRINNMDSFTKLPGEYTKVMQLLRISYDKLPSHLKPCFAYCSLRGRDVELYPSQLMYIWNAHGLLQLQDENADIEGCGYACAMELVSRSLLEHPTIIFNDTILSCKIHDLLHQLAEEILGEELAVVTRNKLNVSESTRHIIWGYEGPDGLKGVQFPREQLLVAKKARTFKFGYRMSNVSLSFLEGVIAHFSYLRVLEIGYSTFEELPQSIGKLKHLRDLKISFNPFLKRLPDTVCKLLKLENLDFYCCETLEKLPKKIYRLVKLRKVSVTTCQKTLVGTGFMRLPSLRVLVLCNCKELELLWDDDDIGNLSSLRYLGIQHCQKLGSLPNSMKGLTNLEELWIENCEELDIEKGECMNGLQSLGSLFIQTVPRLKYLPDGVQLAAKSLKYLFISDCSSLIGLGTWSQSFTVLRKIVINNCPDLVRLPEGFLHIKFLESLWIRYCRHLSERCAVPNGADYPLIQHVPDFWLDGQFYAPQQIQSSTSSLPL